MDNPRIATNMRLFYILDVLSKKQRPLTPSEINHELQWSKQTVHRLCKSMVEEGFLTYDSANKRLLPSAHLRTIACGLMANGVMNAALHQALETLSAKVQETVNFVLPEIPGMRYKDRVLTNWAFQVNLPIGSHVPFHCTASGKTYLASLPPTAKNTLLASLDYQAMTHNTHRSMASLQTELKAVKKQGYALDNEEFMEGMVAIAVPVYDARNKYHGALAFHGPTLRLDIDKIPQHYQELRNAADQLTHIIFSN